MTTPQYQYRASSATARSSEAAQAAYASQYASYYAQQSAYASNTLADNYESWYMESTPTNRMVLSLRSAVPRDTEWALERLLHLTKDWPERFWMKSFPGMGDALWDLAEWLVRYRSSSDHTVAEWACADDDLAWRRKSAIEAALILRNASMQDHNMHYLEKHARTFPIILSAFQLFGPSGARAGEESEFLLYLVELFHSLAPRYHLKHGSALLRSLVAITASPDRTLLRASLAALTALFSSTYNAPLITLDSPAFLAALRALPIADDPPAPGAALLALATSTTATTSGSSSTPPTATAPASDSLQHVALDALHAHLAHQSVTKAFFRHPLFPGTLRLLLSLILHAQGPSPPEQPHIVLPPDPADSAPAHTRDLSEREVRDLWTLDEPERAVRWMRKMFVPDAGASLTQVAFWNLYRDVFTAAPPAPLPAPSTTTPTGTGSPPPPPTPAPHLNASELIKNVALAFPGAQAMVMPDRTPPTYIIKGIRQRGADEPSRFACRWRRGGCLAEVGGRWEMADREELWAHLARMHLGIVGTEGEAGGEENERAADVEMKMEMEVEIKKPNGITQSAEADVAADPTADADAMDTDPPAPPAPASPAPPAQTPDIIPDPSAPIECLWSGCPHTAANLASLRRHVLVHIPSANPQPSATTSTSTSTATAASTATPPPAPAPLSAVATSALLILHILFREAYPTPLPHSHPRSSASAPPSRAGFPFASLLSAPNSNSTGVKHTQPADAAAAADRDRDRIGERDPKDVEGERHARAVFRGVLGEIERVRVGKGADGDGILMRWVEEMRWRVGADAYAERGR